MQSSPAGVPPFVSANIDKVDLQSLQADLHKYANAGLDQVKIEWWHEFIKSLELNMTTKQSSPASWLLDELVDLKATKTRTEEPTATFVTTLPQQLINMRNFETRHIPEVCLVDYYHYYYLLLLFQVYVGSQQKGSTTTKATTNQVTNRGQ